MGPRIFITGVTGYIGGHTLSPLQKAHPEYQLVTLVRNESQAKVIKTAFPAVETVIGNLDSDEVLQNEAGKADVVLNLASADHIAGALSLIRGLANKPNSHFIHISGTGIMTDMSNGGGNLSSKIYHDTSPEDVTEILSFDLTHIHRDVEEAIISAAKDYGVKVAIISPPTIHGVGEGPVKKRSIQVPILIEKVLERGKAFQVGEGKNVWNSIHIDDVASAIVLLMEEALKGTESRAAWLPGAEGYYFTEDDEFRWSDISTSIAEIAHAKGLIKSTEVDKLSVEEATALHPWGPILWGGNSRGQAGRLRELGWKTTGRTIAESLPKMVEFEFKAGEGERQELTFLHK